MYKAVLNSLMAMALFASSSLGLAAISIVSPIATPAAHAGWIDRIQLTGAYARIGNNEYFLGDYNESGGPVYPGVLWELRNDGQIVAKGYGRLPKSALWLIQKFFQPIPVS